MYKTVGKEVVIVYLQWVTKANKANKQKLCSFMSFRCAGRWIFLHLEIAVCQSDTKVKRKLKENPITYTCETLYLESALHYVNFIMGLNIAC